jgi:predicted nucleotidyltransferase
MMALSPDAIESYRRGWRQREARKRAKREAARLAAQTTIKEQILALVQRWPTIRRVYLFGSVIQPGAFHEKSDVDVAIEGATGEAYFGFWRELDEAVPQFFIDVREIDAPSSFADEVRRSGILVYEREDLVS